MSSSASLFECTTGDLSLRRTTRSRTVAWPRLKGPRGPKNGHLPLAMPMATCRASHRRSSPRLQCPQGASGHLPVLTLNLTFFSRACGTLDYAVPSPVRHCLLLVALCEALVSVALSPCHTSPPSVHSSPHHSPSLYSSRTHSLPLSPRNTCDSTRTYLLKYPNLLCRATSWRPMETLFEPTSRD